MENEVQLIKDLKRQLDTEKIMLKIPDEAGIYKVIRKASNAPVFKDTTTAINSYKGRTLIYSADMLYKKLEQQFEKGKKINSSDRNIMYIGKANNLLRRISQLVKYAYGESQVHRGGRALWQMENWQDELYVEVIPCKNPEIEEKKLLEDFKSKYGNYPLANWKK